VACTWPVGTCCRVEGRPTWGTHKSGVAPINPTHSPTVAACVQLKLEGKLRHCWQRRRQRRRLLCPWAFAQVLQCCLGPQPRQLLTHPLSGSSAAGHSSGLYLLLPCFLLEVSETSLMCCSYMMVLSQILISCGLGYLMGRCHLLGPPWTLLSIKTAGLMFVCVRVCVCVAHWLPSTYERAWFKVVRFLSPKFFLHYRGCNLWYWNNRSWLARHCKPKQFIVMTDVCHGQNNKLVGKPLQSFLVCWGNRQSMSDWLNLKDK